MGRLSFAISVGVGAGALPYSGNFSIPFWTAVTLVVFHLWTFRSMCRYALRFVKEPVRRTEGNEVLEGGLVEDFRLLAPLPGRGKAG